MMVYITKPKPILAGIESGAGYGNGSRRSQNPVNIPFNELFKYKIIIIIIIIIHSIVY
jgi:hypothetical protein